MKYQDHDPKVAQFMPTIFSEGYALVLVNLDSCTVCKEPMLSNPGYRNIPLLSPKYPAGMHDQIARAKWQTHGKQLGNGWVCKRCIHEDRPSFTCALCGEQRGASLIQQTFGYDPAEHLCKICYKTRTAKEWETKCEDLEDEHRYDAY